MSTLLTRSSGIALLLGLGLLAACAADPAQTAFNQPGHVGGFGVWVPDGQDPAWDAKMAQARPSAPVPAQVSTIAKP